MLQPADAPSQGSDPTAEAAPFLAQVRELAPRIAAAAEQIEQDRRVPAPLLEAMLDAGLFRMLLPRSVGGAEVHPLAFMQVVEALAHTEASPAWNVCQNAVCAMTAAYLTPEAARHIFGGGRIILAWGPPTSDARAVAENGGYRVTGNWAFASGGRHATWFGGLCTVCDADGTPRRSASGGAVKRVMLFPAEAATMTDVWKVIGLRGTASDAFAVQDLLVPQEHSVRREDTTEVREPGWLYRFTTMNVFSCGFASIALGVARSMLEAFIRLASEKTPRGYSNPLRENAATQQEVAQAEAKLSAAHTYLVQTVREVCEAVQATHELTVAHRVSLRLATTHAIQQAMQVGDFAYEAAGATAIFTANPFERRFRDLHAITQQIQGRKSHYQTAGKFLLGLDPDLAFI